MSAQEFSHLCRPGAAVGNKIVYLEQVDSTNHVCQRLAQEGAKSGLVVIAGSQSAGKGTKGRCFLSLPGKGLYLSLLLRPQVPPELLQQLTSWVAVAVCRAVEGLTGLSCGIKWPNDVLLEDKKLCGILTELFLSPDTNLPAHVVVGMGVNLCQTEEDFGPELAAVATSLGQHMAVPPSPPEMAQALLDTLGCLLADFPARKESCLQDYRRRCHTVGRQVMLHRPGSSIPACALDIEEDFSLRVRLADGREELVRAGEVSVRGLLGYL